MVFHTDCYLGRPWHFILIKYSGLSIYRPLLPLDMKGCICHFVKWQIHPFITKWTNCHPNYYLILTVIEVGQEISDRLPLVLHQLGLGGLGGVQLVLGAGVAPARDYTQQVLQYPPQLPEDRLHGLRFGGTLSLHLLHAGVSHGDLRQVHLNRITETKETYTLVRD